jgi:hypothetical protein
MGAEHRNFGNLSVAAMTHIGEVPPVLKLLAKGRFGAARPFPPGPWTEHS